LLLGGREAIVSGVIAALESPIIGYGSWPLDREGFYLRACELSGRDPDPNFYKLGYPLIPTHSHVMCAWVENGIGGLVFWSYVIFFYVRQILRPVIDEKRMGLYLAVSVLSLVWHILFSPMAGRIEQSVVIALIANDAYGLTIDAVQRRMQAMRRVA
jgi:O-antigen ligase